MGRRFAERALRNIGEDRAASAAPAPLSTLGEWGAHMRKISSFVIVVSLVLHWIWSLGYVEDDD